VHPGERVRQRRLALGLKPSQVEHLSNSLAFRFRDPRYAIPHSTLAGIEAASLPSIHKMLSLAYCLRLNEDQVLEWYGINSYAVRSILLDRTRTVAPNEEFADHGEHKGHFPFKWPSDPCMAKTELLNGLHVHSGASLDGRFRYARIGSKDHSMMDIVPAGSFVRIDTQQRKVSIFSWESLWHRPIYFIWHQFGHCCRWCQQNGNELLLIPHPASHEPASTFRMSDDVSIVGRILSVWPSQDELAVIFPD